MKKRTDFPSFFHRRLRSRDGCHRHRGRRAVDVEAGAFAGSADRLHLKEIIASRAAGVADGKAGGAGGKRREAVRSQPELIRFSLRHGERERGVARYRAALPQDGSGNIVQRIGEAGGKIVVVRLRRPVEGSRIAAEIKERAPGRVMFLQYKLF